MDDLSEFEEMYLKRIFEISQQTSYKERECPNTRVTPYEKHAYQHAAGWQRVACLPIVSGDAEGFYSHLLRTPESYRWF